MPNAYGGAGRGTYGRAPVGSGRGRDETEEGRGGQGGGGARGFANDGPQQETDRRMMSTRGERAGRGGGREASAGGTRAAEFQSSARGGRGGAGNEVVPFGRGEMEMSPGGVSWEIEPFGEY